MWRLKVFRRKQWINKRVAREEEGNLGVERSGNDGRTTRQGTVLLRKRPERTLMEDKSREDQRTSWTSDLQANQKLFVGRILISTWPRKQREAETESGDVGEPEQKGRKVPEESRTGERQEQPS